MPTNTMAKAPALSRRSRAFCAISEASRSCGRPPAENSGNFCPRTRLFIRSIAVTPVSMKSSGSSRSAGFIRRPSMRSRRLAIIGGPPSVGLPTPSSTRPSKPGPTDRWIGSPRNRTRTPLRPSPTVDSRTSTIMLSSSMEATRPRRTAPRSSTTSTASMRPTSTLRLRNSSGPSMAVAVPWAVSSGCMGCFGSESLYGVLQRGAQIVEGGQFILADLLAHALKATQHRQFGDRLRRGAAGERLFGQFDEAKDDPQHRALTRRRTVSILGGKRRLAKESLVDEFGADERQLLRRRQRVLADDARHALETGLLLEKGQQRLALSDPGRVAVAAPPRGEALGSVRIGLERVDRRIEARLGAVAVEPPEAADEAFRMAGHRLGKVARRWA